MFTLKYNFYSHNTALCVLKIKISLFLNLKFDVQSFLTERTA